MHCTRNRMRYTRKRAAAQETRAAAQETRIGASVIRAFIGIRENRPCFLKNIWPYTRTHMCEVNIFCFGRSFLPERPFCPLLRCTSTCSRCTSTCLRCISTFFNATATVWRAIHTIFANTIRYSGCKEQKPPTLGASGCTRNEVSHTIPDPSRAKLIGIFLLQDYKVGDMMLFTWQTLLIPPTT